jgi:MGT family glycosyltransferase
MATFVFLILPSYGHVNPTLAVARGLVDQGHRVIYYLTPEFRNTAAVTGAIVRQYDAQAITSVGSIASMLMDATPLSQVLDRVRADAPDVIVNDSLCMWSILAAQALRVPTASVRPTYAANEHFSMFSGFSAGGDLSPAGKPQLEAMLRRANASIAETCAHYDLEPMTIGDVFRYVAPLNIVFLPREFQPAGDTFDERYQFVGPAILPRNEATDFPLDQLDPARPLLYVSLGTIFNNRPAFFKQCFDAFGETASQVVMSCGAQLDSAALGPVPDNVLVSAYVPQLEILARTRVFITHAGMNSVMEGIYYGVPFVAIPQMPEQAITARRVGELGLGIAMEPTSVSVTSLQEAVASVASDDGLPARTRAMQQAARVAGGYQRAAEALSAFADGR